MVAAAGSLFPGVETYAWNGLRKVFAFCGVDVGLPFRELDPLDGGSGLVVRITGRKLSSSNCTKFEGKRPIALLSLCRRPIHQDPSPALRHSIRSPSTNPRSLLLSPPHYVKVSMSLDDMTGRQDVNGHNRGLPHRSIPATCLTAGIAVR